MRIRKVPNLYYRRLSSTRTFGGKQYKRAPILTKFDIEKTSRKTAATLQGIYKEAGYNVRVVKHGDNAGGGASVFVAKPEGGQKNTSHREMRQNQDFAKISNKFFMAKNAPELKKSTAFRRLSNNNLKRPLLSAEERRNLFAKGKLYPKGRMSSGIDLGGTPEGRYWDSAEFFGNGQTHGWNKFPADKQSWLNGSHTLMGWKTGEWPSIIQEITTENPGTIEIGVAKIGDIKRAINPKYASAAVLTDFGTADNWASSSREKGGDLIRIGNSLYRSSIIKDALSTYGNAEVVVLSSMQKEMDKGWQKRVAGVSNWRAKPTSLTPPKDGITDEMTNGEPDMPLIITGEEWSVIVAPFRGVLAGNGERVNLNEPQLYLNTQMNQVRAKTPKQLTAQSPKGKDGRMQPKNRPAPINSQNKQSKSGDLDFKISAWVNPPAFLGLEKDKFGAWHQLDAKGIRIDPHHMEKATKVSSNKWEKRHNAKFGPNYSV